ncbi:MAG TPA: hypothetical protein VFH39_04480 [Candidatus Saccharimonadales bacterium]|nr:hypothetical protein [Candidatus Saccharimonadales bacterium]
MFHHWQDVVLAICILGFNVALVPSVFSKSKPAVATRAITASALALSVIVYISLSLWYTVAMQALNCGLWVILGVQGYGAASQRTRTAGRRPR